MISVDMIDVARELQDFCDKNQWRCCFIGGIAEQRWGEALEDPELCNQYRIDY